GMGGIATTTHKRRLIAAATAGGTIVNLSSTDSGMVPPASVTVPAGATSSPNFTITTSAVSATAPVTISAVYNGVTKTATLTVNPVALLSITLSPASVVRGVCTTG